MLEHGQGRQPEEVELDQARLLDVLHVELGRRASARADRGRAAPAPPAAGRRSPRPRHGSRRCGAAPRAAGRWRSCRATADPSSRASLSLRLQLDRLGQGHRIGRVVRHQLADPVDQAERQAEHPADVAQGGARLQRAEGDDLRDPVRAVAVADVADHLVAPVLAEVDVEVRHRHALGVEEALEQQAEAERIEIGDGEAPGDDRAGARAATRPDRNAVGLRPADEVGDDQEIARETSSGR